MAIQTTFARWIAGVTLSAVGLWSISTLAANPVPATLTQQGRILDTSGTPVSSKVHFVFTIYDDPTATKAADALWTDAEDITLDDGYFSWQLGTNTAIPSTVFDGSVRYLGVTVGSDAEMTPREVISSVPYAMVAGSAASVPFSGVTGLPAACADGSYLKGFAADGTATCATVPALSCHTVTGTTATAATNAFIGCPSGEFMTGGGCYSNGTLAYSYPVTCNNSGTIHVLCLCLAGSACVDNWNCGTTASASITPYIRCCTVL
jgi:hypothetical protein